jgi:hypothetical protein
MNNSLSEFKSTVLEHLLGLLWRQWSALGVAGYTQSEENKVVDPEALLLLTLTVARHDARLFDEVLDWLDINGAFLNVQRLHNLLKQYDFQAKAELSAVADWLGRKSNYAMKWKKLASAYTLDQKQSLFYMKEGKTFPAPKDAEKTFSRHGLLRNPIKTRGLAKPFPAESMPSLLLRLRALLGVNIRCEIFCLLGSVDEIHPSEIAKLIGQAPRSTQNALAEMARSGVVQVRSHGREKSYALKPGILDNLLRPDSEITPWVNSAPLFRALEILWLGVVDPKRQNMDELMLSSELRRVAKSVRPLLGDAGWGQPLRDESAYKGEKYKKVFFEDVLGFLEHRRMLM